MIQIENYKIIPIGRCKDLSNQQFGDYKVLYRTEVPSTSNSKQAHWLCQCVKCNKYFIKPAFTLTKGTNECECKYDLTNRIFGRWTVIGKAKSRNNKGYWKCRCICGNEKEVESYLLTSGQSKSCGCLNRELAAERCRKTRIDLTGQRFGKLVALFPIYSENGGHTLWHCKCDCGNECDIDMGNLRQGFSQSCGCTHSKNEENIIKLLTKNNIPFEYQKRFDNLKIKEFDFYINNNYIIEFDGQQHFFPVDFSGKNPEKAKENFEINKIRDNIKNEYCKENNINLLRIPYTKFENIENIICQEIEKLKTFND